MSPVAKSPNALADADLKLQWAEQHIGKFELEIRAFHDSYAYSAAEFIHPETGARTVQVSNPPAIPPQFIFIACDAVHNMRTALDYLVCELALANSKTTSGVSFPITSNKVEFGGTDAQRRIRKLSSSAKTFIRSLRPYKGGNDLLWALHAIDRVDKHLYLRQFSHAPPMFYFTRRAIEDNENAAGSSDSGVKYDYRVAVNPGFDEIDVFQGETALTLLKKFLQCVDEILSEARRRFFPSTQRVVVFPTPEL